jgi:integrase
MSRDLPWEDVQTLLDELDLPHSLDYELPENLRKQGDQDYLDTIRADPPAWVLEGEFEAWEDLLPHERRPVGPTPKIRPKGPGRRYVYLEVRYWDQTEKMSCGPVSQSKQELERRFRSAYAKLVRKCQDNCKPHPLAHKILRRTDPTLETLIKQYLNQGTKGLRAKTKRNYEQILAVFGQVWDGDVPLSKLRNSTQFRKHILQPLFLRGQNPPRSKKPWTTKTYARHFLHVERIFNAASKLLGSTNLYEQYGAEPVSAYLKNLEGDASYSFDDTKEEGFMKYYSWVAFRFLLRDQVASKEDVHPLALAFLTLCETGRRPGEIRRMIFPDIAQTPQLNEAASRLNKEFNRLEIVSKSSRGHKEWSVQFPDNLRNALKHRLSTKKKREHDLFVFTNSKGKEIASPSFSNQFTKFYCKTMTTADRALKQRVADYVSGREKVKASGKSIDLDSISWATKLTANELRHYFITDQYNGGAPLDDIQRMVGHDIGSDVTKKYYFDFGAIPVPRPV